MTSLCTMHHLLWVYNEREALYAPRGAMNHSPSRSRILFYNDAPSFGGHEVMSAHFANALAVTAEVSYLHSQHGLPSLLAPGVNASLLPFSSTVGPAAVLRNLHWKQIRWLRKEFHRLHPDVICVVQGAYDLSLRGAVAGRSAGYHTVSYVPMVFPRFMMGMRDYCVLDHYTALFFHLFHDIITINTAQRQHLKEYFKAPCPVHVLENCIPVSVEEHAAPQDAPLHDPLVIGFIGRLDGQQKGLDHLIRLAESLQRAGTRFRFVVFGDGPDRESFVFTLRKQGLSDFFHLAGWQTDVQHMHRQLDILVLPSRYEGVPMVLLEALMAKKPVLARLSPGTQVFADYLPQDFLYSEVEEGSRKLMRAALYCERFATQAENLRQEVIARHHADGFAERARALFHRLLHQGKTRS